MKTRCFKLHHESDLHLIEVFRLFNELKLVTFFAKNFAVFLKTEFEKHSNSKITLSLEASEFYDQNWQDLHSKYTAEVDRYLNSESFKNVQFCSFETYKANMDHPGSIECCLDEDSKIKQESVEFISQMDLFRIKYDPESI